MQHRPQAGQLVGETSARSDSLSARRQVSPHTNHYLVLVLGLSFKGGIFKEQVLGLSFKGGIFKEQQMTFV